MAAASFLKPSTLHFPTKFLLLPSSSSSSSLRFHAASYFSLSISHRRRPLSPLPARAEEAALEVAVDEEKKEDLGASFDAAVEAKAEEDSDAAVAQEVNAQERRPCELYACNLPRSCDISQLLDLFQPYGTVVSVEVSRDAKTGLSRGSGFVTMSSIQEAKAAMTALDGSDLGGREMCVKFSADMTSGRTNIKALYTTPKKNIVFESPHKAYIGNLSWFVKPENLRKYFSEFGSVLSTRVLYDRKGGKNRVYGFISFASDDELKAAVKTDGSVFHGRTLVVREVINSEDQ
ncbi:28 kDa ribonucleoprotein, chloroplastic-like [Zingiber officinale]|uniref:28 kDa ribonucleoprotein, chloroplastic-like n=1 Tax=Zingiber officinale TaxID=94328 RepID=UPI001C4C1F48|nr:28 kDa ribonucleoprotein, chloroplastic-like [Zingiber officinale]